jgi:Zn-dependent protease with chaperone function
MKNLDSSPRWMAVILVLCASLLAGGALPAGAQFNLYSRDDEIKLGQQASTEADKQLPVLPASDPVSVYVRHLGERLAANTPEPRYPYTFKVVNQKEINAFSLPGGPVYINLGTIQAADNEAQVAGVMAHEIGHVVKRHGTQQATKGEFANLLGGLVGAVAGRGAGGALAQLGAQIGGGMILLKYSRTDESQADAVGARLMYDTGYDPHQMALFFEKLKAAGGGGGPQFLSDHPDPGNREQAINALVATLPAKQYRGDSADFRSIKARAATMTPLTAEQIAQQQKQREAAIPAPAQNVAPSAAFQPYQGHGYRLRYPENWKTSQAQDNASLLIAPPAGVSPTAIGYGVLLGAAPPVAAGASLDDIMKQVMGEFQKQDANARPVGSPQPIRVNGMPGRSVEFIGTSPVRTADGQTQRQRDWLVTVQSGQGTAMYLVFIAPETEFDRFRPAYENMLRSFHME